MKGYFIALSLMRFRQQIGTNMVIALMLGVGAGVCMVMLSIALRATSDPLPGRSQALFRPELDVRPAVQRLAVPDAAQSFTWVDAQALLRHGGRWNQAVMAGGSVVLSRADMENRMLRARYATSGVFATLGISIIEGRGWTAQEGDATGRVAVISRSMADRECQPRCLGHLLDIDKKTYTVVGIADDWHPAPGFHGDLRRRTFSAPDEIYLPVETAMANGLKVVDGVSISGGSGTSDLSSPNVAWLQLWAHLPSTGDVADYKVMLHAHALSRGLRTEADAGEVGLWSVQTWLDRHGVVPPRVKSQLLLSILLLCVCLVNAGGLLNFMLDGRRQEISIRRALGARRRDVFAQLMWEASIAGAVSSVLAMCTYAAGILVVRSGKVLPDVLTSLSFPMLVLAAVLGLFTATLCAVIPALSFCRIAPTSQAIAKGAA